MARSCFPCLLRQPSRRRLSIEIARVLRLPQSPKGIHKLLREGWTISEVFPKFFADGFDPVLLHRGVPRYASLPFSSNQHATALCGGPLDRSGLWVSSCNHRPNEPWLEQHGNIRTSALNQRQLSWATERASPDRDFMEALKRAQNE